MTDGTEQLNDAALLGRYVENGDRDALGALFARYVDAAFATAMRVCRNRADAEDAVQTAFIQVMRNAAGYRSELERGFRAWLMKIVVNSCKGAIRGEVRRRNREEAAVEQDDALEAGMPGELNADGLRDHTREVLEELDKLPDQYRTPIWLHYYEGMSRQEAAQALGWSEKSLSNQVFCGMKKLRQRLAERGITASMAGLTAVIPLVGLDSAPAALVERVAGIAGGASGKAGVASTATGSPLVKAAVTLICIGAIAVVAVRMLSGNKADGMSGGTSSGEEILDRSWDFDKPGMPPEFKVLNGVVRCIQGDGTSSNGCLQVDEGSPEIIVDIPIRKLPVTVSWRERSIVSSEKNVTFFYLARPFWFPADNVVTLKSISPHELPTVDVRAKYGTWNDSVCFITPEYADYWRDGQRYDVTLWNADVTGRVSLVFVGRVQIDNVRIKGVSKDKLPDAGEYVKLAGGIRTEKDDVPVAVRVPAVDGRPTNVVAKYYRHVDRWEYSGKK